VDAIDDGPVMPETKGQMDIDSANLRYCRSIQANDHMKPYVKILGNCRNTSHNNLLKPFDRLLSKGFIRQGRTITFKYFAKVKRSNRTLQVDPTLHDLVGYEHAVNRLHVEDYVPRKKERYHLTLLQHALALGVHVINSVKALAPRVKVRVTICIDENVRRGICVFSFHLRRTGQDIWPNIDIYKNPCVVMES
jgi:hypothetical protein